MTYGIDPGTGPSLLLGWLARPYDPVRVVAALLGLPARTSRQLVGTVVAGSPEADDLLQAMPTIVRSLAIATTDRPQRCYEEIRGPVLWAETVAARAASAGHPGLYVCATTTKAYDTDENRVLKAALEIVHQGGRHADTGGDRRTDALSQRARHNSLRAARLLDHQTLAQVALTRPDPRALQRARAGSKRRTYRPALAMLRRGAEPLGAPHLHALADERTRAQLDALAATIQRWQDRTGTVVPLRVDDGVLVAGPVSFRHPRHRPDSSHPAGIRVGDVLVDVPDPWGSDPELARARLEARADVHAVLALDAGDIDRALQLAAR